MSHIVEVAKEIAQEYHKNQVDRAGVDYFRGHLTSVAKLVDGDFEKATAYLHDILEDTPLTLPQLIVTLIEHGVPNLDAIQVANAVHDLTRIKEESYDYYLTNIKENELARIVKIADLTHNSDLSRLIEVTEKDLKRTEKYARALNFLQS